MRPILFSVASFDLKSSALLCALGALAAIAYVRSRREARSLSQEDFWGLLLALFFGVFVGAAAVYAAFYGPSLAANLGRLAHGRVPGGSFFGVFWGAAAAGWLFCRRRGIPFAPLADDLAAGGALGLPLAKVGCLLGGCCRGRPTSMPWGLAFTDPASRVPKDLLGVPLHPTQLYEAGGAALIFLALRLYARPRVEAGRLAPGSGFLLFVMLYAGLRFLEDFFRAGDPGRLVLLGLSTGQLLAGLTGACAAWAWAARRAGR